MESVFARLGAVAFATLALVAAQPALSADESVIEDVLAILKDRGLVDEGQYTELVHRNQQYEEQQEVGWWERIEFSGDMRARFEHFSFENTVAREDRPDRTRGRYRLRIGMKAKVNENVDAVIRIASGEFIALDEGANRSTNRSFGHSADFAGNSIFIDQAYIHLKAPSSWVGESGKLSAMVGKTKNPFRWKGTKDLMLWDSDINPEGVGLMYEQELSEATRVFANAGYFIAKERSTDSDPHVAGVQLGIVGQLADALEAGGRVSFYDWRALDTAFQARGGALGNVPMGQRGRFGVLELAGYLEYSGVEHWPLKVYGHIAQNFNAQTLPGGFGKQDTGWMVGGEVGDKKEYLSVGLAYVHFEANFWPAQFTDSDWLDGVTNREGFAIYGSRRILHNTDLGLTLLFSEPIEQSLGLFGSSVARSDRFRLQADLQVYF